jgi:hypothetical protein
VLPAESGGKWRKRLGRVKATDFFSRVLELETPTSSTAERLTIVGADGEETATETDTASGTPSETAGDGL